MKKQTSARIEDILDVLADKIIDLDNTAKKIEQIEKNISKELTRAEDLKIPVDLTEYTTQSEVYVEELEELHKKHLKAIDKKNKIQRPLYYLIYTLFITILCLCFVIGWFKIKNNDLETQNQEIYKHHYKFIKDKNLDAIYQEWIGDYGD